MSSQIMQQPYVPQPPALIGDPNTVMGQPQAQSHSHSHSTGSFTMVFVVLASIAVISAIACCLGRFCNRRADAYAGPKQPKRANSTARDRGHPPKEDDVESGLDNATGPKQPKTKGDDTSQGHHEGENDIKFSFERRVRAPRSGFKPFMEGGFGYGPN
ncbi:hypothetical protein SAY86_019062 [Trapa natans]|uniref:Transmembrane protein n=1 Tax=Trapa natans TaxID=22666 RepID=A0AAN7LI12_TRANT|nr:hypothetical protein SAY86_019062 [Trapa natans]